MYTIVYPRVNLGQSGVHYALQVARKTKPTLQERLARIMAAMDWTTKAQLAKAAGASRQTVQHWFDRGPDQEIGAEYAFNLFAETRFNVRWILTGEGPERAEPVSAEEQYFLERYRLLSPTIRSAVDTLVLKSEPTS